MNRKLRGIFSIKTIGSVLSTFSPGIKMVRYFENPYLEDATIASPVVNKQQVSHQIDQHVQTITKRFPPISKNVEGGLYLGTAGAAYMFYKLSKNPFLSDKKQFYLDNAMAYIQPALQTSAGDRSSFLLGDAGTYAIATVLNNDLKNGSESQLDLFCKNMSSYKALYDTYLNPKFLKCGGDELFVGRAGYLAGVLWMSRELQTQVLTKSELYKICDIIVNNGRDYSLKHRSACPLMYHYYNTEYLGAAHGVSFILQTLLSVPGYLQQNKSAMQDVKVTTEFIASLQNAEGNWPCCMEEIGLADHKLVHWCHGAPGTIYLMAKAYLVFKDKKYLEACIKAGELVWQKGLLRKGPGICHGVAGNGYVFLLLYRLTGDDKYMYRAKKFAEFMESEEFVRDARFPDHPESLYEGIAGTVCFLSDLLVPDKAEFPFEDVFSTYDFITK